MTNRLLLRVIIAVLFVLPVHASKTDQKTKNVRATTSKTALATIPEEESDQESDEEVAGAIDVHEEAAPQDNDELTLEEILYLEAVAEEEAEIARLASIQDDADDDVSADGWAAQFEWDDSDDEMVQPTPHYDKEYFAERQDGEQERRRSKRYKNVQNRAAQIARFLEKLETKHSQEPRRTKSKKPRRTQPRPEVVEESQRRPKKHAPRVTSEFVKQDRKKMPKTATTQLVNQTDMLKTLFVMINQVSGYWN